MAYDPKTGKGLGRFYDARTTGRLNSASGRA
jgi:hypothetical protein